MRRRAAAKGNGSSDAAQAQDGDDASAPKPRSTRRRAAVVTAPSSTSSPSALALLFLLYSSLFLFVRWRLFWTPEPLPLPPHIPFPGPAYFTEGGARAHVNALAGPEAPGRQVSSPGLRVASNYVLQQGTRLQRALEEHEQAGRLASPGRARIACAEQHVGPGAFSTSFLVHRFTNAYRRLTNVVCLLEPLLVVGGGGSSAASEDGAAAAAAAPAVVLVSHIDAPVSSPGAGDDASQVAAMLELLRAYAAAALLPPEEGASTLEKDKRHTPPPLPLPRAPVLFLFNGGEEPLCQAAHGFLRHPLPQELALRSTGHPPQLGAFINLESIGPGGVPIVFQHGGAWTVRAYARSVPAPRGSSAAQDAFDLGLVVGETDYSRLTYQRRQGDEEEEEEGDNGSSSSSSTTTTTTISSGGGSLPGLDIAYVADGAAYHTDRDTPSRLRSGVLQETGEAVAATVAAMAGDLADAAAAGDGGARLEALVRPGGGDRTTSQRRHGIGSPHRAVFFSVGSAVMVRYGHAAALVAHSIPLLLALAVAAFGLAPRASSPGIATAAAVLRASLRASLATLLAVALPAALGALRAWLSGAAIAWYSSPPLLAALIYFPPAAAAMLWSSAAIADGAARGKQPAPLPTALLGAGVMNGAAAAALTWAGFGCAFIFAAWAYAGVLAAVAVLVLEEGGGGGEQRRKTKAAATATAPLLRHPLTTPLALAAAALPALIGVEQVCVFAYVLAGRLNLSGATAGIGAADAAIGAVAGAGVAACTGGVVAPLLACALGCGRGLRARRAAVVLLTVSVAAAAVASLLPTRPYSASMPKRLLMARVHFLEEQQGEGSGGAATAATAKVRVARSGWAFGGTDPNPVAPTLLSAMLEGRQRPALADPPPPPPPLLPTDHPLGIIYPIDSMADVVLLMDDDDEEEEQQHGARPLPSVRLVSDRVAVAGTGDSFQQHRELEIVALSPQGPCWGLVNVTIVGEEEGARLLSWSLAPGVEGGDSLAGHAPPASHLRTWAGGGSVREHVVRWTSEEEEEGDGRQGARLPMSLRVWPANSRVRVELHVAARVGTPHEEGGELAKMAARLPEWAALTWESTTYIGAWEF
jgi:hypothetical protein